MTWLISRIQRQPLKLQMVGLAGLMGAMAWLFGVVGQLVAALLIAMVALGTLMALWSIRKPVRP